MKVSLQLCPGLRRSRPLVVEALETTLLMTQTVPRVGGFGPLEEGGPELVAPRIEDAVVGYLTVVLQRVGARFTPEQFLKL